MPRTLPSPLLIAALCIALGSVIDATVKGLALSMAVPAIVAWRFLVGGSIALGVYRARPRPLPSLRAIRFHALRGAVQVTSALLFFWSLTQLALAEATVIGFTSALMIAPLGAVILKEPVTRTSAIAAATGFLGAIFAVSAATGGAPETGQRVAGAAAAFLAAFLYAVTLVLIRLRSREEDPLTIAMFSNVFPALFLSPLLVLSLPGLDVSALPVLVLLGILGFTVWWLFSIAYSRGSARLAALCRGGHHHCGLPDRRGRGPVRDTAGGQAAGERHAGLGLGVALRPPPSRASRDPPPRLSWWRKRAWRGALRAISGRARPCGRPRPIRRASPAGRKGASR